MEDSSSAEELRKPSSSSLGDQVLKDRETAIEAYNQKPVSHWILLLLGSTAMLVAFPASSLLSRVYFSDGGKSKWIISWVAIAGWPFTALVLIPMYFFRKTSPAPLTLKLAVSYVVLSFLTTADNLMYV
ncbi:hypothetical protein MLD38_014940 [Melastoma candidum]|uniref:Uncharacterized protein n=1 Tax=Melastoma candidum TaxID=119954 RepID=A0ACB9RFS7_9MYRT|nr:hypothetical protein MLD38_014940 [Melastoma candidum]